MKNIVIFSGTTEGRTLSELLCENGIPHLISVATEYGKQLCPEHMLARVVQGRMNAEEMAAFLIKEQINLVIDATHPYAVEVTENIRQAVHERSKQGQAVKYLRYVRETNVDETASVRSDTPFDDDACVHKSIEVSIEPNRMRTIQGVHKIHYYGSAEECEQALHSVAGNILLTTGSKELSVFCQSEKLKRRLIVRVLPGQESIALCEEQGLLGKQIIAMQGPFSEEMNLAIIRQYQVSCMVTKQSGRNGGFMEKLSAAAIAGIPMYVIGAPAQEMGNTLQEILREIGITERNSAIENDDNYKIGDSEQSVHENSELSADRDSRALTNENSDYSGKNITGINMKIKLVGCGMGTENTLTVAAQQSIERADILLGASRLIEPYTARLEKRAYYLAKDIIPYLQEMTKTFAERHQILSGGQQITGEHGILVENREKNPVFNRVLQVVILFSGDTGFYSGCEKLYSALDKAIQDQELSAELAVLPGISSVSYLAARLHTSWENAAIMSVHGRGDVSNWKEELIHTVQDHEKTFLLVSRAKDVADVFHILQELAEQSNLAERSRPAKQSNWAERLRPAEQSNSAEQSQAVERSQPAEERAMCAGYRLYAGYQLSYPEEQMIYYEIGSREDEESGKTVNHADKKTVNPTVGNEKGLYETADVNDLPEGLYICLIQQKG